MGERVSSQKIFFCWSQFTRNKLCYLITLHKNGRPRLKYSQICPCSHLYYTIACVKRWFLFLSCHIKFHMNWTSFRRSPVLKDHFFSPQRWPFNTVLTVIVIDKVCIPCAKSSLCGYPVSVEDPLSISNTVGQQTLVFDHTCQPLKPSMREISARMTFSA